MSSQLERFLGSWKDVFAVGKIAWQLEIWLRSWKYVTVSWKDVTVSWKYVTVIWKDGFLVGNIMVK